MRWQLLYGPAIGVALTIALVSVMDWHLSLGRAEAEVRQDPVQEAITEESTFTPIATPMLPGDLRATLEGARPRACLVYSLGELSQAEMPFARLYRRRYHSPLLLADLAGVPSPEGWLLMAIGWRESRWNARAIGDHGASCGWLQVNTRPPGRPTCTEMLDPRGCLRWVWSRFPGLEDEDGLLRLSRYNGRGAGADRYEREVWRADYLLRTSYERCM